MPTFNNTDNNDDYMSNFYTAFILLSGVTLALCAIALAASKTAQALESKNRFDYKSRAARITAGAVVMLMLWLHSKPNNIVSIDAEVENSENAEAQTKIAEKTEAQSENSESIEAQNEDSKNTETKNPKNTETQSEDTESIEAQNEDSENTETKVDAIKVTDAKNKIIVVGPHRTSWDAALVLMNLEGEPVRCFATTAHNSLPGVKSVLNMFEVIPVKHDTKPIKGENGEVLRSANADALDEAAKIISEGGRVLMFPQGNIVKKGQKPPTIYDGSAKLAIATGTTISAYRIDGFTTSFLPERLTETALWKLFLSVLCPGEKKTTYLGEIDVHLKKENIDKPENEKIALINAELFAYYRHTENLALPQIQKIKTEIKDGIHNTIWGNRTAQDKAKKQLELLEKTGDELVKPTAIAMGLSPK